MTSAHQFLTSRQIAALPIYLSINKLRPALLWRTRENKVVTCAVPPEQPHEREEREERWKRVRLHLIGSSLHPMSSLRRALSYGIDPRIERAVGGDGVGTSRSSRIPSEDEQKTGRAWCECVV